MSTAIPGTVIATPEGPVSVDETIVLALDFGKFTNRRRISSDSDSIDTDIDRKSLHVGIDLIDAPELRACQTFQTQLRAKLKPYIVPSFFRGGIFLVKIMACEIVNDLIKQAKVEFLPIVQAFADVVDVRRDEAESRLKGEYDPTLYPTREEILAVYRIEHRWFTMSTPASLKKISVAVFEQEREKAAELHRQATDGITALLAAEAKAVSAHLIERLTPNEDGSAKQIRKSVVENISEYLSTFNFRNIGSSEELNEQVNTIQRLITGVDAKDLRLNESLRADVQKGFIEVTAALDKLIVDTPRRRMVGEED